MTAYAQHNLIEVPSSEIVENRILFTQAQLVLERDQINTSAIVTYGVGHNLKLGLAFYEFSWLASHPRNKNSIKIIKFTSALDPPFW